MMSEIDNDINNEYSMLFKQGDEAVNTLYDRYEK